MEAVHAFVALELSRRPETVRRPLAGVDVSRQGLRWPSRLRRS